MLLTELFLLVWGQLHFHAQYRITLIAKDLAKLYYVKQADFSKEDVDYVNSVVKLLQETM